MATTDDLLKRIERLESSLSNGQGGYVRRETVDLMMQPLRDAMAVIRQQAVDAVNAQQQSISDQKQERKALRNIVIAALLSGIVSILVAITVAAVLGSTG